ncbi:MAG: ROK family transcriptional regulator [Gordonia sp. (in: high G+C Gram-positive bacteria)]
MPCGVVPATLQLGSTPAAAVLHAVRGGAPITRDRLAEITSLSPATINRQVNALTTMGLIVERRDLVSPGVIGRPKSPITLDQDSLCVAGLHIGAQRALLAIADIGGRTLYSHAVLTPTGPARGVIATLCGELRALADRFSGRRLLWGGAAVGGFVDTATGEVDHPILGWRRAPLGEIFAETLGVPVSISEHVQAMAAAELLLGQTRVDVGSGLFFYARETTGMALTLNGRVHIPSHGAGGIAHVRVDAPVICPGPARLQDVIGAASSRRAAERLGVAPDSPIIVDERSRILGEVIAVFRDAINPDAIIVAGDAFSAHPRGLAPVQAAFDAASTAGRPLELMPSRFGVAAPESAAIVVALSVIYADPVAALG